MDVYQLTNWNMDIYLYITKLLSIIKVFANDYIIQNKAFCQLISSRLKKNYVKINIRESQTISNRFYIYLHENELYYQFH